MAQHTFYCWQVSSDYLMILLHWVLVSPSHTSLWSVCFYPPRHTLQYHTPAVDVLCSKATETGQNDWWKAWKYGKVPLLGNSLHVWITSNQTDCLAAASPEDWLGSYLLKSQCIQSSRTFDSTSWPLRCEETLRNLWQHAAASPPHTRPTPTLWANVTSLPFRGGDSDWCCNELLFVWLQAVSDDACCCHSDFSGTVGTESPSESVTAPCLIKGKFSNNFSVIFGIKYPYPGFISSFFITVVKPFIHPDKPRTCSYLHQWLGNLTVGEDVLHIIHLPVPSSPIIMCCWLLCWSSRG